MKLNDIPKLMPVPFGVSGPRTELLQSSPAGDRKASYKDGFPPITMLLKSAGGLPPDGGNMNQILFELASGQRWSNAGAGYKFNATFSDAVGGYPKGAQLLSNDGTKVYVSTKDDNKTDFNSSPGAEWVTLGNYIGLGDYATKTEVNSKLAKDQNGADIPDKPKFIENLGLPELLDGKVSVSALGNLKDGGEFKSFTKTGFYLSSIDNTSTVSDMPSTPSGQKLYGYGVITVQGSGGVINQQYTSHLGEIATRQSWNGGDVWNSWQVAVTESTKCKAGSFELMPFRAGELPAGWYSANGDLFELTSPQGVVLNGLSPSYKTDWNITVTGGKINIPNIRQPDGRTPFLRPINGTNRQVGNVDGDKIRNISGRIRSWGSDANNGGAFTTVSTGTEALGGGTFAASIIVGFSSDQVVPTGPENKPLDIGVTLAIYLGV